VLLICDDGVAAMSSVPDERRILTIGFSATNFRGGE